VGCPLIIILCLLSAIELSMNSMLSMQLNRKKTLIEVSFITMNTTAAAAAAAADLE
jgi:hypothetical protein